MHRVKEITFESWIHHEYTKWSLWGRGGAPPDAPDLRITADITFTVQNEDILGGGGGCGCQITSEQIDWLEDRPGLCNVRWTDKNALCSGAACCAVFHYWLDRVAIWTVRGRTVFVKEMIRRAEDLFHFFLFCKTLTSLWEFYLLKWLRALM